MRRIPDWISLAAEARQRWSATSRPRARTLNAVLNSFVKIMPAQARPAGSFNGLPYAAKDIYQTPTHQPSGGLATAGDLGIVGDSNLLDRFDSTGADFVGFTGMTELAYEPSGFNASLGRVKNPWNLDYISGGSSSGSAAAVASGAVVAALGSDTGGSLRIPAHACGVTAWKPSYGSVSTRGTMPLAPTLDTIGLLARSAADLILLAPIMSDLRTSNHISRVVLLSDVVDQCERSIRRACENVLAALAECGLSIEQRKALHTIDAIDANAMIIMQGESARVHRARIDDPTLAPMLRRRLAKGLEITDDRLAASVNALRELTQDFETKVLAGADVALLPVMAILTPSAAECDPASERFSPKTLYALSRFTRFVNALGFPAVACPAGFDDRGLPVAVQIVGHSGSDLALLELVRQIQVKTDWHGRVPTAIANLVPELGHIS